MFPFYLPFPEELLYYISRILWKHQLFKIREKLEMDGVFHRHIDIVKYISNSQFYRVPWQPPPQERRGEGVHDVHDEVWIIFKEEKAHNSTQLCFRQDPIPDISQILLTTIDLKHIRTTVEVIKGKVM
jgi:hypothetical protein